MERIKLDYTNVTDVVAEEAFKQDDSFTADKTAQAAAPLTLA